MHWKICKEFGIEVNTWLYEHEPKAVTKKDSVTILWDVPIRTDRTIAANRPDIVLKNKKTKPSFSLTWLIYPSTPKPQSEPRKSLTNTKTWKSRLSDCGGSKQRQSRWLWEPLAPSRRTAHLLRRRSSTSSRNHLCLPKSMVWIRMLREKITRNYTSVSYIITTTKIIIIIIIIITTIIMWCAKGCNNSQHWEHAARGLQYIMGMI